MQHETIEKVAKRYGINFNHFTNEGMACYKADEWHWKVKPNGILLMHGNHKGNIKGSFHRQGYFKDWDILFRYIKNHGDIKLH